jgi:hypothetical protein
LFVIGTYGLSGSALSRFSVSLEDWGNPLVTAFANRKELFFPAPHSGADRKRRPSTPFEDSAFHVLPLGVSGFSEEAFGLLLVGAAPRSAQLHWFTTVFGQKLDQFSGGRWPGNESWGAALGLLQHHHAVTDPILLTDAEGAPRSPAPAP